MREYVSLADVERILSALPSNRREAIAREASKLVGARLWLPNPGPQTAALLSPADELFFGGQAGGGKTDLSLGAAVTEHRNSLLLRRTNREALGLVERLCEIVGSRDGWNGQAGIMRLPERTIEISGCQLEDDKQKFKGRPHDLICFDEVSDFTHSQYRFIIAWNRTTYPGQRCRVIATGNPPTHAEGLWVVERWAAWLDPRHPNPAAPGELRWYVVDVSGNEREVSGPGDYEGMPARSRTFIPSRLADNPDLAESGYDAVLAALPAEIRAAYREGRFDLSLRDADYQVIPSAWIREAQARWTPEPPDGVPMCSVGVDCSGGGDDPMIIARRHAEWFAPMIEIPGSQIPMDRSGAYSAGLVVSYRRDSAVVVLDMGGGYGSSLYEHLRANDVKAHPYKGSEASSGRTVDRTLGFANVRSAALWDLREALDPSQPGGSDVAFPDDPKLVADLTAPTFQVRGGKIVVESKESVCTRLGRSTDRGDAVIIARTAGLRNSNIRGGFRSMGRRRPEVIIRR